MGGVGSIGSDGREILLGEFGGRMKMSDNEDLLSLAKMVIMSDRN